MGNDFIFISRIAGGFLAALRPLHNVCKNQIEVVCPRIRRFERQDDRALSLSRMKRIVAIAYEITCRTEKSNCSRVSERKALDQEICRAIVIYKYRMSRFRRV